VSGGAATGLAAQAELLKLAATLGVTTEELAFLGGIEAEQLRVLRDAIIEHLIEEDRPLHRRLARLASLLPMPVAARLAPMFGPLIVAGIVAEFPARRGAQLATRIPPEFTASAAAFIDPRKARDLIRLIPIDHIVDVALIIDSRDDFMTLSRFVDYVSDEALVAAEEAIPDEGRLLRIAFLMESKNRIDHLFRMLPPERIQRLLQRVQANMDDLLPEFLSLLVHVSYGFKRELGDIIAAQDEEMIASYIRGAHELDLWADVLPVVAAMSEQSRQRVVNLEVLREHDVQLRILQTAQFQNCWGMVLPMIGLMSDDSRTAVAKIMDDLPEGGLASAVDAALMGERWDVLTDLVARMSTARQEQFVEIVHAMGAVDPDLARRVMAMRERVDAH
jgi:hypothetical protein